MPKNSEFCSFKLYCCMFENCNKEYRSKFNLKRHVQVYHLRAKQVQCHVCFKFFRIQQNLIEHSYIHTQDKPYSCRFCGEKFRHKSSHLKHERSFHYRSE